MKLLTSVRLQLFYCRGARRGKGEDYPKTEKIVVENGVIFQSCRKTHGSWEIR